MTVVPLSDTTPYESDGRLDRDAIVEEARKNARKQGNARNTAEKTFVYVPSIGSDVLIRRRGLEHGITRNDASTALATMSIGDLLRNSVAVNELNGRTIGNRSTEMSYVLMAIGKDKTNPYFVRIVVDKTTKEVFEISTYGLYAIKAKKEGAHFMPEGNEAVGDENRLSPYLRSKVSIAQVLEDVKGISIANEVFSEDVAKRLGVRRTKGSLSNDLRLLPLRAIRYALAPLARDMQSLRSCAICTCFARAQDAARETPLPPKTPRERDR